MGSRMIWRLASVSVALFAIGACGGEPSGPDAGETGSTEWACADDGSVETCTAVSAMTVSQEERELYTCGASEGGTICPPAVFDADYDWACIAVRRDLTCQRGIMVPGGKGDEGGGDYNPGNEPDPSSGGDENPGGGGGDQNPPDNCEPGPWKDYFVALANGLFADAGIDLNMTPSDIADQLQFDDSDIPPGAGDKPACEPIISQLQQGSWLGVVEGGCMNLNMEITAWCQNTHNFAASEGACNAGAGW